MSEEVRLHTYCCEDLDCMGCDSCDCLDCNDPDYPSCAWSFAGDNCPDCWGEEE